MDNLNKRIWIVNYYSSPPEYVSNPRHIEFAKHLLDKGHDVTIFSSGYLADKKIELVHGQRKYSEVQYDLLKFVHIRVKHYTGNGIARMVSIFQFAYRIFKYRKKFLKPDIILHNIHAPFDYPILWCANRLKSKYIVEAWDLWPDSFVRFGLISENNPLTKLAYWIERRLYEKSDKIIFTFEGGKDYLKDRNWTIDSGGKIDIKKIYYINNGVNISEFNSNTESFQIHDDDLENDDYFKVVYLGSIRLVNDVKNLIDAADSLKDNKKYKFLIYGDGSDRDFLENYCKIKSINNVIFKEKWIPFSHVPYVLSKSSLNILNYQKDFGLYGISSGKFFQYLASGKPICCNIELNYDLITKHKIGIAKDLKTNHEYAAVIQEIANLDTEEYNAMCLRVDELAKQFDTKVMSGKLLNIIEE